MAVDAGNGDVLVPLTLPLELYRQTLAMAAYDNSIGFSERGTVLERIVQSLEGDVRTWLGCGDESLTPAEFLAAYEAQLEAGQHPEAWPPRPVAGSLDLVTMGWVDAHACKLLGAYLAEHPHADLRDLCNAALRFLLEDPEQPGCRWKSSRDVVGEAKRFRLAAGEQSEVPAPGRVEAKGCADGGLLLRLDGEAAEKLHAYRRLTGRELEDIASAAVIWDVGQALDWQDRLAFTPGHPRPRRGRRLPGLRRR